MTQFDASDQRRGSGAAPKSEHRVAVLDLTLFNDGAAPPRSNGELVFDSPWHSRAFGLATALAHSGTIDFDDFRQRLMARIAADGQHGPDDYYARWVDALVALLEERGLVDATLLREREGQFAAHERDEVF